MTRSTAISLGPGRYSYTVDAPLPWADLNGEFEIAAGEYIRWPVWGQH
ncbi:MAG: hypothetical protein ACOYEW_13860 [Anaerolineae bacterium]|jgi:hypothetical protein